MSSIVRFARKEGNEKEELRDCKDEGRNDYDVEKGISRCECTRMEGGAYINEYS